MNVQCPHCGHQGSVPEYVSSAPQMIRCPKCKTKFSVKSEVHEQPDLSFPRIKPQDDQVSELLEMAEAEQKRPPSEAEVESLGMFGEIASGDDDEPPPHSFQSASPKFSHSPDPAPVQRPRLLPNAIPDDPWFYGFVDIWANISLALAVIAALACAAGLVSAINLYANNQELSPWPWVCLSSLAVGIACMTTSAFTHVLLDLARNIRRLRIHADHDAGIAV